MARSRHAPRLVMLIVAAGAATTLIVGCASAEQESRLAAPVEAEGPAPSLPTGEPWVVSLGDSIISGEAGRWAGNQTFSTAGVDALGSDAYADGPNGELIARCHRSKSAAIHIGDVASMNLACSGAKTKTAFTASGDFKPGIDFYDEGGHKGQALLLQEFAADHRVELVALSIGANDFMYESIIEACVKAYLAPSLLGFTCQEDEAVAGYTNVAAADQVRVDTTTAILNIATAMENAGYQDSDWTLGLQLYPNLIASPDQLRYRESGYERQLKGGCGFRDEDLRWLISDTFMPLISRTLEQGAAAAQQARPSLQIVTVDASAAFAGRTLCHESVHRVGDDKGAKDWRAPEAADVTEWAMEINILNLKGTYRQESMHPNYWGQLALRSCWRQAWNDGDVRGGTCKRDGTGLNESGEPNMRLS